MRVALVTYGTRGDVQPFVALGLALRARGHDVVVAAPRNHVAFIARAGLTAVPLSGDSDAILASEQGQRWVMEGSLLRLAQALLSQFRAQIDAVDADAHAAIDGADIVVSNVFVAAVARAHAEQQNIPWTVAHTFPGRPTRAFPPVVLDAPHHLPGPVNRATSVALHALFWRALRKLDDSVRARHGLAPARDEPTEALARAGTPGLHLWSPTLLPTPSDWPAFEVATGFCALPSEARRGLGEDVAARALEDFLAAGPPPLYLGLGSMPLVQADRTLALFVDVVSALGARAVVAGMPASVDVSGLPASMITTAAVDHDVLFPRCAGVLHHGGAGTTHASVRAGRPAFVCTVFGDQPFWGRVVAQHGVGGWTHFRHLTRERCLRGLGSLFDGDVVARAAGLGARLQAEPNGADAAAVHVEAIARAVAPHRCGSSPSGRAHPVTTSSTGRVLWVPAAR